MANIESRYQIGSDKSVFMLYNNTYNDLLKQQTAGHRMLLVSQDDVDNLLQGVSTDGILPSKGGRFQKEADLAQFALSGIPGIGESIISDGNAGVIIVGSRFGGGSAREHAPKALKGAGVEVVIVAGKAEKIFKENCLFAGGPVVFEISPDADEINKLLGQILNSHEMSYQEPYVDAIRPQIRKVGGLFAYTKQRVEHELSTPIILSPESNRSESRQTIVQKILSRKIRNINQPNPRVVPGDVGFVKTDLRFSYEFMTKMIIDMLRENGFEDIDNTITDKSSIALFEDHLVWAPNEKFRSLIEAQRNIAVGHNLQLYKQADNLAGSAGICHTLIVQNLLALPGDVVIGTDSHTCSAGVLGAFAFGVGATAMANAFITKDTLVEVPESVSVSIQGKLPSDCSAKDVMLKILADSYIKSGHGIGKVLEYSGDGLRDWSLDQLFVLTNMAVEGGAMSGLMAEAYESIVSHIENNSKQKREEIIERFVTADPDALYAHVISINLNDLEPMVATPGHPSNGVALSQISKTPITSAYVGSCTGGNMTDLLDVTEMLKGRKTRVPLTVQPASMLIYEQAERAGLLAILKEAGAEVLLPGCGACIGMGPGSIRGPQDVILSATNRNFPGRMGKPTIGEQEVEGGFVYLASPRVVAASSINGYICSPKDL